ncbi:MAG: HYR domain-containing protein, partial [Saprospiraceae bacterium]|nr:HYR domain-containing protein [Saprospiraceae bacterium]
MKKRAFTLFCSILIATLTKGQCPPPGFPESGNTCFLAPVLCENLDGYCNTINNNNQQQQFQGCGGQFVLNNDEWFAFTAGTTTISIQVTPSNCTSMSNFVGLQAGIYRGCNGPIMDLQCDCAEDPFVLTSTNYVIGQVYYFVIDGCAGDVCDYSIDVIQGSTVGVQPGPPGPISGDSTACGNSVTAYQVQPVFGATQYQWTINPPNAGFFLSGGNSQVQIQWSNTFSGEAEICVKTSNACNSNDTLSCKTVQIKQKPSAHLTGGGVICEGLNNSVDLSVNFSGTGPWGVTPTFNGVPQTPIETSVSPFVFPVTQAGVWKLTGLYETELLCEGEATGIVQVTLDTVRKITIQFCPGETVFVGGQAYTQPGIIRDTLGGGIVNCNSVIDFELIHLPQPFKSDTFHICSGEQLEINGQFYNQPGIYKDTIPGQGCDTLATYVIQSLTPAPSSLSIQCPQNISIIPDPGMVPAIINYNLPTSASDCICPGLNLSLTSGFPSGAGFPNGLTKVCYQVKDSCGQSASCCFDVMVREVQPCDVKVNGCMRYELLSINADQEANLTYRIRVVNNCTNKLIYTAIQLPDGVTALAPPHLSVFTSEGGLEYDVRNPNFTPFYSVRFKTTDDSISNGQSDIFSYTLPAQSDPD